MDATHACNCAGEVLDLNRESRSESQHLGILDGTCHEGIP